MKVLFLHEFGPSREESMMLDLIQALGRRFPELDPKYFTGFLKRYAGAGTSPKRLLNLCYMFLALPFVLLTFRPEHIFTRTAPPGIQLWAVLLGLTFRIPVSCWLMDYHPEVELRLLKRRKLDLLGRPLELLDRFCLRRLKFIVVLDDAMRDLVQTRAPKVPVLVHPTWNKGFKYYGSNGKMFPQGNKPSLKIAYAGNLGASHPLKTLAAFIRRLQESCTVTLIAVGASEPGEARLKAMADEIAVPLTILPRTAFNEMGELFQKHDVDVGLVLMDDELAGCLSPSKFSAYIAFGLPLLYIGPRGTNSDLICSRFEAGFSFPNNAGSELMDQIGARLLRPADRQQAARKVKDAADYFLRLDENSLASVILPYLTARISEQRAGRATPTEEPVTSVQ